MEILWQFEHWCYVTCYFCAKMAHPLFKYLFIRAYLSCLDHSLVHPTYLRTSLTWWPRLQTAPYSTVSQERNNKDPDLSATGSKEGGNSTLYLQRTVRSAQRRHSAEIINQQWYHESQIQGLYSLRRHRLISIGIPIINLRRSSDRLRFIMGIPIPVRRRLLSE